MSLGPCIEHQPVHHFGKGYTCSRCGLSVSSLWLKTATTDEVLSARQQRAETLHDLLFEARETIRTQLAPSSPSYLRTAFDKLHAALYVLRGDPFNMDMTAALAAERAKPQIERIVAVAVRHKGMVITLPKPARHPDILRPLFDISKDLVGPDDQGFLTDAGRFVGRREATSVAVRAGQIEAPQWPPDLYSEDLW